MQAKKKRYGAGRLASFALAVTLLLSLCTGCKPNPIPGPDPDPNPDPDPAPPYNLTWDKVNTGAEIKTLNVVLVIDMSASTLENDPDHNSLEAACMFLNTLYASSRQQSADRVRGSKDAHVGVILYNDKTLLSSETLRPLRDMGVLKDLTAFVRKPKYNGVGEVPSGSGDSALTDALNNATNLLLNHTVGQEELSARSVILLFTDGYKGYAASSGGSAPSWPTQIDGVSGATSSGSGEIPAVDGASANSTVDGVSSATTAGSSSAGAAYASAEADTVPDFGDGRKDELKAVLDRAKNHNYEIIALMFNPDNRTDGGWEEFKKMTEYTKRSMSSELMKVIYSHWNVFEGMSFNDFTWPKKYELHKPAFLDDPMYGGGVFPDPDRTESSSPYVSNKVNYLMATSPWEIMEFYTTLAANMLSGSSADERTPGSKTIQDPDGPKDCYSYNVNVPNSGVSALMCFFFSKDGVADVIPNGPDPDHSGQQIDYKIILRKADDEGWANNGAMRNDWYQTSDKSEQFNISTLTVINPTPGMWTFDVYGKDGQNRSLHAYATLVNGTKANINFAQGNDPADGEHPVTGGDFVVQFKDENEEPLPMEFYGSLKTKCEALRIPPWLSIPDNTDELTNNFTGWLNGELDRLSSGKPNPFLTQMSGGEIAFAPGRDYNGVPALTGHFDAPLPGVYYMTLTMTAGEGLSQIDYSKSFWVTYKPKTEAQVIGRAKRDVTLLPPYNFPEAWGKVSNADVPEIEDLTLTIDEKSVKITPSDIATYEFDSRNPEWLVLHCKKKTNATNPGKLSFDVTTEYGDRWTLEYDFIIQ